MTPIYGALSGSLALAAPREQASGDDLPTPRSRFPRSHARAGRLHSCSPGVSGISPAPGVAGASSPGSEPDAKRRWEDPAEGNRGLLPARTSDLEGRDVHPSAGHAGLERGVGVLGGSVRASWGGTPGGCPKKWEVLRGPELTVHGGMGGPRVVQRSGGRQAPVQGPGGRGSSWRKLGPSVPSPNQVQQIKAREKHLFVLNSGHYRSPDPRADFSVV